MHISRVDFDNKSFTGIQTALLGPKTLIVGPNEGHKSAIVEAVLYGMYGKMPDILNRRNPVSIAHMVKSVTTSGKQPIVRLFGDNGILIDGTKILPRSEHPYLEALGAFSGSADSALDYIIRYFDTGEKYRYKDNELHASDILATFSVYKGQVRIYNSTIEQKEEELANAQAEIDKVSATYGNTDISFILAQLERAVIRDIVNSIKEPQDREAAREPLKWLLSYLRCDLSALRSTADISDIFDHIQAIRRSDDYRAVIPVIQNIILETKRDVAILDIDMKALEAIYSKILIGAVAMLTEYVNSQIAPHDEIAIDMTKGYVGVYRNDGTGTRLPHWSMSGSVQARVIGAIAAATGTEDTYSVVALPDRAWDEDHLSKTMEMLEGFNSQILITNTFKPKKVPKSWTVLEVK